MGGWGEDVLIADGGELTIRRRVDATGRAAFFDAFALRGAGGTESARGTASGRLAGLRRDLRGLGAGGVCSGAVGVSAVILVSSLTMDSATTVSAAAGSVAEDSEAASDERFDAVAAAGAAFAARRRRGLGAAASATSVAAGGWTVLSAAGASAGMASIAGATVGGDSDNADGPAAGRAVTGSLSGSRSHVKSFCPGSCERFGAAPTFWNSSSIVVVCFLL